MNLTQNDLTYIYTNNIIKINAIDSGKAYYLIALKESPLIPEVEDIESIKLTITTKSALNKVDITYSLKEYKDPAEISSQKEIE